MLETNGKSFYFSTGPVMGIKFMLNNRLALSTQTTLYYTYMKSTNEKKYPENPEYNTTIMHEQTEIQFSLPLQVSIILFL